MTHFGVISPDGSHLTTCFPLGAELQKRGHRITFLNLLDTQHQVLRANFNFRAIGVTERPLGTQAQTYERRGKLSGFASLKATIDDLQQTMQLVLQDAPAIIRDENITALLVDQYFPVGGTIADYLEIPFITLCNAVPLNRVGSRPPLFTSWPYRTTWIAQLRNQLGYTAFNILAYGLACLITEYRQRWNLPQHSHPDDNYSKLAQLSQQPAEFAFPRTALPSHFHFTGPYHSSIGRKDIPFPWERLTGQPIVYASMGTIQNRLLPVFEAIASACAGLDVQLVISLGGGMSLDAMPPLPGNPLVVEYAPQLALLQKTTLTITHAGLNTTLESLAQGVPMVAIPITSDQPGVAARIVWSGVGEMVSRSRLTGPRLQSVIQNVLTQESYKIQASRIQQAIQSSGGVEQAADIIEAALPLDHKT